MECLNSVGSVLDYILFNIKPYSSVTLTVEKESNKWVISFDGDGNTTSIFVHKKTALELLRNKHFILSVYSVDNYNIYNFNSRKARQGKIRVLGKSHCDKY